MKQEELKEFTKLYRIFEKNCDRVCNILSKYDEYPDYYDLGFADNFRLADSNKEVICEGDEYWSYGGHEHHTGYFDASYLTLSDEELNAIAKNKMEEYLRKVQKRKEEAKKEQNDIDYKKYLELKNKFENESER